MLSLAKFESKLLSIREPEGLDRILLCLFRSDSKNLSSEVTQLLKNPSANKDSLLEILSAKYQEDFTQESIAKLLEYLQRESEALTNDDMVLYSRNTGLAIARVGPEDFYVPAPVTREDGSVVKRGLTLRPEIEAFVLEMVHVEDVESRHIEKATSNLVSTGLLKDDGDSRLLVYSRKGRSKITADVYDALKSDLSLTGTLKLAHSLFTCPKSDDALQVVTVSATKSISVVDFVANNSKFSYYANVLASLKNKAFCEFLKHVLKEAETLAQGEDVEDGGGVTVGPSEALMPGDFVPVVLDAPYAIRLRPSCGYFEYDPSKTCLSRQEINGKLKFHATFTFIYAIDWTKVCKVHVTREYQGVVQ